MSGSRGPNGLLVHFGAMTAGGNGAIDYAWDFGEGDPDIDSTEQSPTFTYAAHGTYTARVTVTDDTNQTHFDEVNILVQPYAAPTVVASAVPSGGVAPVSVRFFAEPCCNTSSSSGISEARALMLNVDP